MFQKMEIMIMILYTTLSLSTDSISFFNIYEYKIIKKSRRTEYQTVKKWDI